MRARRNDIKPESTIFFHNFLRVSRGLLSTIVADVDFRERPG